MTCIIHIGHGKTGSSALQTKLARSAEQLTAHGYVYPDHESADAAKKGLITSGNGLLLLDSSHVIQPNSIYSNENLFFALMRGYELETLLKRLPDDPVFVMYTRDLFSYSVSSWGQFIKRGQGTEIYPEYAKRRYGGHFRIMREWLDAAKRLGFRLDIYNYSRHRKNLWEHFRTHILGFGPDWVDENPNLDVVNRSLTMAEYEVQRLFNKYCENPTASFISDRMVNRLPDIKSETPTIDRASYDAICSRLEPVVKAVNQDIPEGEVVQIEAFEDLRTTSNTQEERFDLSTEQLDVLIQGVSVKINHSLMDKDANDLRDMAFKIEKGEALSMEDALTLMRLAHRARPNGSVIKKKVAEYEAIVDAGTASDPAKTAKSK